MLLKKISKSICLLLIIGLNCSFLGIGETLAFYNDTETSPANSYLMGSLDLSLNSNNDFLPSVTPNQDASRTINLVNDGSLEFNYQLGLNNLSGNLDLCAELILEMSLNSSNVYTGSLAGFSVPASTLATSSTDVLELKVSLNSNNPDLQNKTCNFDLQATGWQINLSEPTKGYVDVETIANTITSGTWITGVVLNEFLPNPWHWILGIETDTFPKGEWVELYNNDDAPYDLSGWYIKDLENNFKYITALNTVPATTTIPAYGWLVVYMNGPTLNNCGNETVALYDQTNNLVDSYSYNGCDYCHLEPTPGEANTEEPSNLCNGCYVHPNKSFARIPDGTGTWVDPIPTPGLPNLLETDVVEEDVYLGFQSQIIEELRQYLVNEENLINEGGSASAEESVNNEEVLVDEQEPVLNQEELVLEEPSLAETEVTDEIVEDIITDEVTATEPNTEADEPAAVNDDPVEGINELNTESENSSLEDSSNEQTVLETPTEEIAEPPMIFEPAPEPEPTPAPTPEPEPTPATEPISE